MDGRYSDLAKDQTREFRYHSAPVEVRRADTEIRVEGYAAVFDVETEIAWFREVVRPGAFASAIKRGDDVVFNYNHDNDAVMARTRSSTLVLTEDDRGLRVEATLDPNDVDVQRVVPKMERGDIAHMSFAFIPTRTIWEEFDIDSGQKDLRQIMDLELYDVSAVTFPAYGETEIGLRARQEYKAFTGVDLRAGQSARERRLKLARHGRVLV